MVQAKSATAFRTISEVAAELGIAPHILRYWETRFPQLRPLTRAGNRRYYRPEDLALLRRIDTALNRQGYTIKGVQKLLEAGDDEPKVLVEAAVRAQPSTPPGAALLDDLVAIRDALRAALAEPS